MSSAKGKISGFLLISILALIPGGHSYLHAASLREAVKLTPIVFDDPSSLILPCSVFTQKGDEFTIVDAGSNSARIKSYSSTGNLIDNKMNSLSTEDATTPAMSGFNPFGYARWAENDRGISLLERHPGETVLRTVTDNGANAFTLNSRQDYGLVIGPGKYALFNTGNLFTDDENGSMSLSLSAYDKVAMSPSGAVFALSFRSLAKFNEYGIPQWVIQFPDRDDGSFLPFSFTASDKEIIVAGVVLPPGLSVVDFRGDYEAVYASNPALPPGDIKRLYGYLTDSGTPLLLSYSPMDGSLSKGLDLEKCPVWVDRDDAGNAYVLMLDDSTAGVYRISPDFSSALLLFEHPLAPQALEGVSEIAVAGDYLYYDKSELLPSAEDIYREQISILRCPHDNPAESEEFASLPAQDGGYLITGLETGPDGEVYIAGARFGYNQNNEVTPDGSFVNEYGIDGAEARNFLADTDVQLIPNAIAVAPNGDLLAAILHGSGSLSTSWAFLFSREGRLEAEFFHLGTGDINEINMVAGGTVGISDEGYIYQCDNIRDANPEKSYLRQFDLKGNLTGELSKFSRINAGLLGVVGDNALLVWQNRYLLKIDGGSIIADADLGEHFEQAEMTDIASGAGKLYILASDGAIYTMSLDDDWSTESFIVGDVEEAAEEIRGLIVDYYNSYGFQPEKIDREFLEVRAGDSEADDLLELFYGAGPFDYETSGRDDFSLLLLGRDSFQKLFSVTRDGVRELY